MCVPIYYFLLLIYMKMENGNDSIITANFIIYDAFIETEKFLRSLRNLLCPLPALFDTESLQ